MNEIIYLKSKLKFAKTKCGNEKRCHYNPLYEILMKNLIFCICYGASASSYKWVFCRFFAWFVTRCAWTCYEWESVRRATLYPAAS